MKQIQFLGMDFTPLNLDHQQDLEGFLQRYPNRLAGYTFATLICWSQTYQYAWAFFDSNTLLISMVDPEYRQTHLAQPEGVFNPLCEEGLLQAAKQLDYSLKLINISSEFIEKHATFCSHFKDCTLRRLANYVYKSSDLAMLEGRRYAKKRNLIAQAEQLYRWTVEPLTAEVSHECRTILLDMESDEHPSLSRQLINERNAIDFNLSYFGALKQKGCLIRIDGHPVAFSIYEEISPETCVIHFEKAERKYKGLYQLINRETARAIAREGYTCINREEDLGLEGLRQAKESYYPAALIPSHILTLRHI